MEAISIHDVGIILAIIASVLIPQAIVTYLAIRK
jgi:hypothetical protein